MAKNSNSTGGIVLIMILMFVTLAVGGYFMFAGKNDSNVFCTENPETTECGWVPPVLDCDQDPTQEKCNPDADIEIDPEEAAKKGYTYQAMGPCNIFSGDGDVSDSGPMYGPFKVFRNGDLIANNYLFRCGTWRSGGKSITEEDDDYSYIYCDPRFYDQPSGEDNMYTDDGDYMCYDKPSGLLCQAKAVQSKDLAIGGIGTTTDNWAGDRKYIVPDSQDKRPENIDKCF